MAVRGIRGATTVTRDESGEIIAATQELLVGIMRVNPELNFEDIASILFSVTGDLVSVHPALAARQLGWNSVPLMCAQEIPVPGSLPLCIRVLIHWNTDKDQKSIKHVYLHAAVKLRPDLVSHEMEKSI